MARSKITEKGQTTVPKEIREHLELSPGDVIDFVVLDNGTVIVQPAYVDVRDLSGFLSQTLKGKRVSLEQMKDSIRERHRHLK